MGPSGSGKTIVGTEVARRLGWDFVDADAWHAPEALRKMSSGVPLDDADREPVSEAQAIEWLLHEDGLLRVPVLVWGDMLVRGYTDELYEQALSQGPAPGGERR